MTLRVEHSAAVPAPPAAIREVVTSEGFLRDYAASLGASVVSVVASAAATRLVVTVPTAGVPPAFARLVGPSLRIEDERTVDGGSASVRVTASRLAVEGTLSWEGGVLRTVAEIRARVPLVGGRVESAVRGLLHDRVLPTQVDVLRRHLGL